MDKIFVTIGQWLDDGMQVALATVVKASGSSPRGVGAKMAVNSQGEMVGSVSGGCVESSVVQESLDVIKIGVSKRVHYGISNDEALDVGLACGGEIEVFIRPLDTSQYQLLKEGIKRRVACVFVTVINGPKQFLGKEIVVTKESEPQVAAHRFHKQMFNLAGKVLDQQNMNRGVYRIDAFHKGKKSSLEENCDDVEVFVDIIYPQSTLVIVGGVHIAIPLSEMARILGYFTVLVDPRRRFANRDRFPNIDRIINSWPPRAFEEINLNKETAVAVLTHDPKIDDPALIRVLQSSVFYVGALGSVNTQEQRQKRLLSSGLKKDQVARIHGPIGMDLGSRSPEEIALGIMAEIIWVKNNSVGKD